VTWQLGAFTLLAVALAGGFAWYERCKPDARIVALVATLAAFAALGRIAFAAVPNVKPTTDIVLIAGYALGGGPGFVVGALAGLTSNFFFGQGSWTPWQMAAWGATGLIGAGLAVLTARRIRRWPLAIVCFFVGFGFTAVQDFGDWVTYSDHSGGQLAAYVGKGLGFDLIHAVGCLLFALAFGPSLMRSVERFARRLQVTWRGAGSALTPLIVAGLGVAAVVGLAAPQFTRADTSRPTPASYLVAAQNPDGGFGPAPGQPSTQLYAGWVALGLAASGHNPGYVSRDGHSVLDYVRAGVASLSDPGSLERTILVARAAGAPATDFGGHDLVAQLERDIRRDGSVSEQVNWTSFAVLALRSAGIAPAARTLSWLVRQQDSDGGFNFATAGGASDVDDTGAALEALAGDSGARTAVQRAVHFIRRQQNADGGFPSQPGADSNAQSTAFAVQGLLAVGVQLDSLRDGSPDRYLSALIDSGGVVQYARGNNQSPVWVTGEALMALAGKPLPLAPVAAPIQTTPTVAHSPAASAAAREPAPPRAAKLTRHAHRRTIRARSAPSLDGLAADAAIVTALVLAPVGG
jgi:energy-coupling factor transport system substrate-specific component